MLRISASMFCAVLLGAASGCGGGGGGGGDGTTGGEDLSQYEGAIASSDTAHGQEVYDNLCMACHAGGAPALEGLNWSPAQMRRQVREGSGTMQPMPANRISDEDLEALLAYMVTNGGVAGDAGGAETGGEPAMEDGEGGGEEAMK